MHLPVELDGFVASLRGEPGVVLVEPLALRRLLARLRNRFGATGLPVSAGGAVVNREQLLEVILDVASAPALPGELPPWLILLTWPLARRPWLPADPKTNLARLAQEYRRQLARRYWFDQPLTAEQVAALRRLLGPVAWAEAEAVLKRDGRIVPPATELTVAREYLAEAAIAPLDSSTTWPMFPGTPLAPLRLYLDELLPAGLREQLTETRQWLSDLPLGELPSAPVPKPSEPTRLRERATAAAARGNQVRALLLAWQAGEDPHQAVQLFAQRLAKALGWNAATQAEAETWLATVLPFAGSAPLSPPARFLYDLQNVCLDLEKRIYAVDLMGMLRTYGRLPIKRQLPLVNRTLTLKHLRKAATRAAKLPLPAEQMTGIAQALAPVIEHQAEVLREELAPKLAEVLPRAGLVPANLPERLAHDKLRAELADLVVERGYFDFSQLRDAVARSELKLPDLSGPWQFLAGDALLKADRDLAVRCDGVYHQGEFYLRGFQRLSSVAFGTTLGRFISKYLALPFGGAFMLLEFLQHMLGGLLEGVIGRPVALVSTYSIIVVGICLLSLLYLPRVRSLAWNGLKRVGHGLKLIFFTFPRWLYERTALRWLLHTPAVRWLLRTFVPALLVGGSVALLAWWLGIPWVWSRGPCLVLAAIVAVVANTHRGRLIEERAWDTTLRSWDTLRIDFIPGLFRLIVDLFRWLMDSLERLLYAVDEWLRFRQGEPRFAILWKGVLTVLWFFVTYVFRFAIKLLIEPQINPLKHFPVVTVSHKLLLPTIPKVAAAFRQLMPQHALYADGLAGAFVTGIPGIFGFLAWELQENWRLYAANRPESLEPLVVGHHGETVRRLLRPGFHSGTIPTQFARQRAAAAGRARPSLLLKAANELHHVKDALEHLVERELLAYLAASKRWKQEVPHFDVGRLTTNQIELRLARHSGEPWATLWLSWYDDLLHGTFELQREVRRFLKPQELDVLALSLTGFFRRLGTEVPPPIAVPWSLWLEGWHERAKASAPLRTLLEESKNQLLAHHPAEEAA